VRPGKLAGTGKTQSTRNGVGSTARCNVRTAKRLDAAPIPASKYCTAKQRPTNSGSYTASAAINWPDGLCRPQRPRRLFSLRRVWWDF